MSDIENEDRIHAIWKLSQATSKLFERQDNSDKMAIIFIKEALEILEAPVQSSIPTIDLSTIILPSTIPDIYFDDESY